MEKPNVVLPLAFSYNQRGEKADQYLTGALAPADQRKINFYYEPVKNALTGDTTLYLTKRPGIALIDNAFGDAAQSTYLASVKPGNQTSLDDWIFSISTVATSTQIRVSEILPAISTFPISTISGRYVPHYVDRRLVSNIDTSVLETISTATAPHKVYFTSTLAGWQEITSTFSTMLHRGKMEHMAGFSFQMDISSRIFNSNINTISTWPAANFIYKQIRQDDARGLAKFKNQIIAFGYETAEIFVNGGLSPAPLIPVPHREAKIGLATSEFTDGMTHYYAVSHSHMYFCGSESRNLRVNIGAYSYDGERFEKISTPFIDKIMAYNHPQSVDMISFGGQRAVSFRLSNLSISSQRWLMFFPRYNDWFEWESNRFSPINNGRVHLCVGATHQLVGSFDLEQDSFGQNERWFDGTESGGLFSTYRVVARFKMPMNGYNKKQMRYLGLVGNSFSTMASSLVNVAVSDDDWKTTTAVGQIDMGSEDKIITRLGAYRDRGIQLHQEANVPLRLQYAVAKVIE